MEQGNNPAAVAGVEWTVTRDITVTSEQRDQLRLQLNKLAVHWNEHRIGRDMIVFTVRASEDQWHRIHQTVPR